MDKDPFQGRLDSQTGEHHTSFRAGMQEHETPGSTLYIEHLYADAALVFEIRRPKTGI